MSGAACTPATGPGVLYRPQDQALRGRCYSGPCSQEVSQLHPLSLSAVFPEGSSAHGETWMNLRAIKSRSGGSGGPEAAEGTPSK